MALNRKHILILTPGFPKDEQDENCIPPLQIFIDKFDKEYNNFKLTVVTIHYPPMKGEYKWKKIDVYSCGGNNNSFPARLLTWNTCKRFAKNIQKQIPVNLIHSFWLGECALLGNQLSKKYDVKHINTLMGQDLNQPNIYPKFVNLNTLKFVALSESQAAVFNSKTKNNSDYIIPWGISREDLNAKERERDIDILGVGSLIPSKNFEFFVNVIETIKKSDPKINCMIIGDGTEKEKLIQIISSKELKNNIKLTGSMNRTDVLNYMQRSKILLHTSNFESFGYALAEALSCGCYVVCKNTGFAKGSSKMLIAKNINDFAPIIQKVLNRKHNSTPELPFPLDETISAYKNLYEENIR
ncbi:MAG: glycosyltransferase [Ignavibacterium sp.]|nr:MAG: glycosyltransferase [Ignavibacterium sp.]